METVKENIIKYEKMRKLKSPIKDLQFDNSQICRTTVPTKRIKIVRQIRSGDPNKINDSIMRIKKLIMGCGIKEKFTNYAYKEAKKILSQNNSADIPNFASNSLNCSQNITNLQKYRTQSLRIPSRKLKIIRLANTDNIQKQNLLVPPKINKSRVKSFIGEIYENKVKDMDISKICEPFKYKKVKFLENIVNQMK